jgi:hypothetical protein
VRRRAAPRPRRRRHCPRSRLLNPAPARRRKNRADWIICAIWTRSRSCRRQAEKNLKNFRRTILRSPNSEPVARKYAREAVRGKSDGHAVYCGSLL